MLTFLPAVFSSAIVKYLFMSVVSELYVQRLHSLNTSLCFKYKGKIPEVEYESYCNLSGCYSENASRNPERVKCK